MKAKKKLEIIFQKIVDMSSIHYSHTIRNIKIFSYIIGHKDLFLDVGGGKSPYKRYFSFSRFVSIDLDPNPKSDVLGDACNLPVKKEVADAVTCIEVLEHIEDVNKALIELNYVMKKDGYLVLSVPLLFGVHAQSDFLRWTEAGIKSYLEKAGFRVLKVEKNGGIFTVIGETLRQIPNQVLGGNRLTKVIWAKYGFMFLLYLFLIPVTKFCIALDTLDVKKNFTTGYSVLSMKNKNRTLTRG